MRVDRSNPLGPLDAARLRAFEARLGAALPDDYRAFLLAHNGGCPVPSYFRISESEGESMLHWVYGLHDGPEHLRLDAACESYRVLLPDGLLAIAEDPGGNAVCLALAGAPRGRVYFWDHEYGSEPPRWDDVIEMAPSFAAFCASLFDA